MITVAYLWYAKHVLSTQCTYLEFTVREWVKLWANYAEECYLCFYSMSCGAAPIRHTHSNAS